MKRPAFQFYPGDWRRDMALQSCSVAARGLWVDLLCIAHECEPYGHLMVNGRAMTPAHIARHTGLTERECAKLIAELDSAGVLSRTDDGVIYSRRMVRDEERRNRRAEGGKEGAEHGIKGAAHGSKGGRPRKKPPLEPPLEPPLRESQQPPLEPPPSSSSSSSTSVMERDSLSPLAQRKPPLRSGSFPELDRLGQQVRSLRDEWNHALTGEERELLKDFYEYLTELSQDDWKDIRDYLHSYIPRGETGFQPLLRNVFIKSVSNVNTYAKRWRSKSRKAAAKASYFNPCL